MTTPFAARRSPIVRRWGFYVRQHLAFAGVARRVRKGELQLQFVESLHLAEMAALPQRLKFEQEVRERACSDIREEMGEGWNVAIRFRASKMTEEQLAREVLFAPQPLGLPDR